jgi:hypothetical protein
LAPNGIENAAEVSCHEGTDIPHGTNCTAHCQSGFEPSVSTLHCTQTMLQPYTFVCTPLPCTLPKDVLNSADELCVGNPEILLSGGSCKPRCKDGYAPSEQELSCTNGELNTNSLECHKARPCYAEAAMVLLGDVGRVASPCWEGSVIQNYGHCHALCAAGYTASVEKLTCEDGQLTPGNFTCTPNADIGAAARCVPPVGIDYAQFIPCASQADGSDPKISFKDGEECFPLCDHSYTPSVNKLTCNRGVFSPPTFTCR